MKYSRLYSYYRVVHAVVASVSFVVTTFLIVIVTKDSLYKGISSKFKAFLQISDITKPSIVSLYFYSAAIFLVICSVLMVVTALSRYLFHSKGQNMTLKGQWFIGLYFMCHLTTRVTVMVALFTTAEQGAEVKVTTMAAAGISLALLTLHFAFIWGYKWKFIEEFKRSDFVQKFVHVLVNTLLVVPFSTVDIETKCPSSDPKSDPNLLNTPEGTAEYDRASIVNCFLEANALNRLHQQSVALPKLRMPSKENTPPPVEKDDDLFLETVCKIVALQTENPDMDMTVENVQGRLYF